MKRKQGQMEIMGLAIVVILIVLGMLFAVRFVLFKPQTSYRQEYTTTQLAANMLNTIINTNTPCNSISIGELLQEASKSYSNLRCGVYEPKEYVSQEISTLLNNTLGNASLKKIYYFRASVPGQQVVIIGQEYSNKERERKTQFLTTDAGVMTIILDIYRWIANFKYYISQLNKY